MELVSLKFGPKHKMAAIENYCHKAITILKDEEEREKEIQVVKQIARANGYQTEEVDRVIGKMLARKGEQNTSVRVLRSCTIRGTT